MASPHPKRVQIQDLPLILGATRSECERWVRRGLVPVAERQRIPRWGRVLEVRQFDPEQVAQLAGEVGRWREDDRLRTAARRREAAKRAHAARAAAPAGPVPFDSVVAERRRVALARAASLHLGDVVSSAPSRPRDDGDRSRAEFPAFRYAFTVEIPLDPLPTALLVEAVISFPEPEDVVTGYTTAPRVQPQTKSSAAASVAQSAAGLRARVTEQWCASAERLRERIGHDLAAQTEERRQDLLRTLDRHVCRPVRMDLDPAETATAQEHLTDLLEERRKQALLDHAVDLQKNRLAQTSGFDRYAALFPNARGADRRLLFFCGPTNSGKTHEALRLATEAPTAEVLSPLRLLALEHFEALGAAGVRAGMLTGEEENLPEGATHIARTIEMLDPGRTCDVAVVDEVQMLADPSRGWAWTQAIVGVPARTVVLTGAPEALPAVRRLAAMTGEPLEVREFVRKTPLRVEEQTVPFSALQPGDAVIAFSRRDVHRLRDHVRAAGLSVATIYGALGPEVRRSEAARFRTGEAQVLVATDAIGMGLNIGPLRRVVFSSLSKFDGRQQRGLTPAEIRQIAGRAGRYGRHAEGWATVLHDDDATVHMGLARLEQALSGPPGRIADKPFVRPTPDLVRRTAEVLGTDALRPVLRFLTLHLVRGHPDLTMADMEETVSLAAVLDGVDLPLLDRFAYAQAPISVRDVRQVARLHEWACEHARGREARVGDLHPYGELDSLEARAKDADAWLWLARRYPDAYPDPETVRAARSRIDAEIERRLVETSKRTRKRKPKRKRSGPRHTPEELRDYGNRRRKDPWDDDLEDIW